MFFRKTLARQIEKMEEKLIKAQAEQKVLNGYNAINQYGLDQLVSAEQKVMVLSKRLERLKSDES